MSTSKHQNIKSLFFIGLLFVAFAVTVIGLVFANGTPQQKKVTTPTKTIAVVPAPQSAAQEFFSKMSPEEFTDPDALDDFISRFPDSEEARAVFAIRYALLEKFPTIKDYNDFIAKYPEKLQAQVAIQAVFKQYRAQNMVSGYYDFIKRYPNTEQALVAMMHIQEIMFQYACKLDTEEDYDAFIMAFPDAPQVDRALEKAKEKAIQEEQIALEKFKKDSPDGNLKSEIEKKIAKWKQDMTPYSKIQKVGKEDFLNLNRIERRSHVLIKVYGEGEGVEGITSEVDGLLAHYVIIKHLNEIKITLNDNNKKLLDTITKASDNICDSLNKINQNGQKIKEQLSNLHKVLQDINGELKKIDVQMEQANKALAKLDKHLDDISEQIQEIRFNTSVFSRLDGLLETIKGDTDSYEPDMDVIHCRMNSVDNLEQIALCGYDNNKDIHIIDGQPESKTQIERDMKQQRTFASKSNTTFGKFLGQLVGTAVQFIPKFGPYIAPYAATATEVFIDQYIVPFTVQVYDRIQKLGSFEEMIAQLKKGVTNLTPEFVEGLRMVWNNLKQNIVEVAFRLAEKVDVQKLKSWIEKFQNINNFKELEREMGTLIEELSIQIPNAKDVIIYTAQYL